MKGGSELGQEPEGTVTHACGSIPPGLDELAQQFPQLEILELLGQGGMGIVYKARQPRLDRFVALKILPAEAGHDPAFAERFAREARALAKLTHPGVVTVYDFGESDGRFYLLMEFVDGVNLRRLLRDRRLEPEAALQIVPQICEALQYAHEQGVVHRDIKPENILLDKRGHVKIADFGLAKLLGPKAADSALTGSQQMIGTVHYMAPEQMERPLAVDHRADIYSLGVVFYEMLTGELPLGRFAPPSQKVQVDVRLDKVVLRALEKEPERRYQHASDVKQEVEALLVNDSWLCMEERVVGDNDPPPLLSADSDQLERLVLRLLPEKKIAAIKAFRDKTGASFWEAKKAVEALARKHGAPLSPSSSRDWISIGGMMLCVLGIAALFIPSTKVHIYNVIEPGHTTGNQRWISVLETGQFSWGWSTNMGTFLTLGLYLLGTYSVPRLAFQRAVAIITAGMVPLVLSAGSARSAGELQVFGHIYYTLYVGFYVVCALAVCLLVLGVMALRLALLNTSPDADAASVKGLRRKLHSLWKSALSLCIASWIKGPSAALFYGGTLGGEEAVGSDAQLPGKTSEADPARGSPVIAEEPTSTTAPVPPREPTPNAAGFTSRVVKAFLLIVHVCCLFLFLSFSGSGSAKGHRIQVGFPSPWFEAEGSPTSFNHHFNLASWSWAIAALGALSCYLYGAIRRRETARLSALGKLGANGCLLWFLIVTLAFIVASVLGILTMAQEWSTAQDEAVLQAMSYPHRPDHSRPFDIRPHGAPSGRRHQEGRWLDRASA
jgi:serine/threonine protein kinase